MRAAFPAIALLLAGSLLSGCAAREYQARLDYPPVKEAKAAPASGARSTVYLETFNDIRADRTVVGHVRGHSAAKPFGQAVPLRDVSEWVRDALVHELESAGYRVRDGESAPPGAATVSGNILRVFSYDRHGEVILLITTVKDGRNVLNRTYTGSGFAAPARGATTGELFSESLSIALRAALRQLLADLGKLDL